MGTCVARIRLQVRNSAIGDCQYHGTLLSNGFETRSQGRAQRLSVDRRHASEALPCKSFEPIGRHVRIVRVTLQDCRLGRLRGQPTKHHVIAAWPLLASRVEAVVHLSSFRLEVKRTSEHGWDAARANLPPRNR